MSARKHLPGVEIGSYWDAQGWPDLPGSVVDVVIVHYARPDGSPGAVATIVRAADWHPEAAPRRIGLPAKARMDAKKRAWILPCGKGAP